MSRPRSQSRLGLARPRSMRRPQIVRHSRRLHVLFVKTFRARIVSRHSIPRRSLTVVIQWAIWQASYAGLFLHPRTRLGRYLLGVIIILHMCVSPPLLLLPYVAGISKTSVSMLLRTSPQQMPLCVIFIQDAAHWWLAIHQDESTANASSPVRCTDRQQDVEGFFGGCIQRGTASDTIFSGKAVCEGYARVYEAIAKRAGLECIVVGGHGKGYGFTPLKDGERPPPRKASGHAWNAVKIDNGYWKLLDACWGAGSVCGQSYSQHFKPHQFTASNEMFGYELPLLSIFLLSSSALQERTVISQRKGAISPNRVHKAGLGAANTFPLYCKLTNMADDVYRMTHFPEDSRYFFRDDGRTPSWEEYYVGVSRGERTQWYSNAIDEGLNEWCSSPTDKKIPVYSGEVVRFQFAKVCEHWTSERNGLGKPRLLMVQIHGVDGRKDDLVPCESDGFWWWCDIPARCVFHPTRSMRISTDVHSYRDLGSPGQKVQLIALKTLGEQDGRGVTKAEFLSKKGRCGMSWDIYAQWELV